MTADWVSAWAAVVTTVTAIVGVWFGVDQLAKANRTLKLNSLAILLSAETELSRCKSLVSQASIDLRLERANESPSEQRIDALLQAVKQYREDWNNAADRLAYCIINGYIDNDRMQAEYRNYFHELIKNDKESFGEGTEWRNVVDLNRRWQRS